MKKFSVMHEQHCHKHHHHAHHLDHHAFHGFKSWISANCRIDFVPEL